MDRFGELAKLNEQMKHKIEASAFVIHDLRIRQQEIRNRIHASNMVIDRYREEKSIRRAHRLDQDECWNRVEVKTYRSA